MWKWIVRGVAALIVLALIAALAGGGWLASRFVLTQPKLKGDVAVDGLSAGVTIVRDAHGVPHIFGETDADVYFALGYAHAQDRYFQMDLARRLVLGRLSELFGERAVTSDARARIRGDHLMAQAQLDNLSPDARAAIDAYAAGVNARLAEGVPAPEYAVLRQPVEGWSALDTAAMTVLLANDLVAGLGDEIASAELRDQLSPEQIEQFLTGFPDWAPTTLKDIDVAAATGAGSAAPLDGARAEPDISPGSNAWIVSGDRTGTGAPLLANDPHLGLSAPSIWYLARLELDHGPVIGATIPGMPSVILGRNAWSAWGFTNTGFDVMDLVPLSEAGPVTERIETIAVHKGEPVEITVRTTPLGPVMDAAWFSAGGAFEEPQVLRSAALDPRADTASAIHAIAHATNWEEFVEAGRGWTAPMQNMHYAHIDGTIGYATAGLLPLRDEDGAWSGYVPFEALPRVRNPEGGIIASGNNLVAGAAYPHPLPGNYAVYRAPRIEDALEAAPVHSIESFEALLTDVTSVHARRLLPALRGARPETQLGIDALSRLEMWDGTLSAEGAEGLIFAAWMRSLARAVYADELEDRFDDYNTSRRAFIDEVLNGDASRWCDDVRTAEPESCAVSAGRALDAAMAETVEAYGEDMDAWVWGEAHQALWDHPFTGQPVIGGLFTVREPMGGDGSTVNVAHFSFRTPGFDVFHAASYRAIYDLADLNRSRYMHAPGQSGHPLSRHYRDLAPLWAAGESFEIRDDWAPESAPEGARILRLTPR